MTPEDRIELTYHRACRVIPINDREDVGGGSRWYSRMALKIMECEPTGRPSPGRALAVAAVLSPRVKWDKLLEHLPAVFRGEWPNGFFGRSIDKAERILGGEHPDSVIGPRSPKVLDFWRALQGEPVPVIDVWAARVAGVDPHMTFKQYAGVRAAYVTVGQELGVRPDTLQAVTWVAVRDRRVPIIGT